LAVQLIEKRGLDMDGDKQVKKVGASAFQAKESDLYDYSFPDAAGKQIGTMYLRAFPQPVLDRYRDLRNGDGRRKGDPTAARAYLLKKTYAKFEFLEEDCELDIGECKTDPDFFMKYAEMQVDAVLINHLEAVFPGVDSKKSQSQLD
jgi:hypothetical protein